MNRSGTVIAALIVVSACSQPSDDSYDAMEAEESVEEMDGPTRHFEPADPPPGEEGADGENVDR